jgi:hypothetical protein
LRLASKVDRLAAVLEVQQVVLVAAPREVSIISIFDNCRGTDENMIEFAHGKVDPHEAGKKGGNS